MKVRNAPQHPGTLGTIPCNKNLSIQNINRAVVEEPCSSASSLLYPHQGGLGAPLDVRGCYRLLADFGDLLQTHETFRILSMNTGDSGCPQELSFSSPTHSHHATISTAFPNAHREPYQGPEHHPLEPPQWRTHNWRTCPPAGKVT